MNANRRKRLTLALSQIELARIELESVRDEEREKSRGRGKRGDAAQTTIAAIEGAICSLKSAELSVEIAGF